MQVQHFIFFMSSVALAQSPELVIHHAKVFTGTAGKPFAEAVAVQGDRILAVGKNDGVLAFARDSTRRIDAAGRVVVPGFNDAHIHVWPQYRGEAVRFNSPDPSWEE